MKNLIKKILREEEDYNPWEWAEEIKADLIPGETYYIRSANGIFWSKETFVGVGDTNSPATGDNIHGYKFKTEGGTGWMSVSSVRDLIDSGGIREYDPEWSIIDELDKSDNLDEIETKDFSIYFPNGINISETLPIQEELTKKGFRFWGRELGDHVLEDEQIDMIESINWDTSHDSFRNMDSEQRTKKLLTMHVVKPEDNWLRTARNDERKLQEDLWVLIQHKGILIDGNSLLENLNAESN